MLRASKLKLLLETARDSLWRRKRCHQRPGTPTAVEGSVPLFAAGSGPERLLPRHLLIARYQ